MVIVYSDAAKMCCENWLSSVAVAALRLRIVAVAALYLGFCYIVPMSACIQLGGAGNQFLPLMENIVTGNV